MANLDGSDDIFDSREVIARISEMELEYGPEDGDAIDTIHTENMTEDEREEYDALIALREEVEGYVPDFPYGETFISDDYFEEYAQQLAEEIGAIDSNVSWPLDHIDWEAAAYALKMDYISFEFMGTTYWARA